MTTGQRVEAILKASRKARDSDKELLRIYMVKSGLELTSKQFDILLEMPAFETITRIRRKYQERGMYRAEKLVDDARFDKFKKVRGEIGAADERTAEELLESRGYRIADD